MILSFEEKFKNGEATNFESKVLSGEKIHSLRENKKNRWRIGMTVQHSVGMRTTRYRCFKSDTKCTMLQTVHIFNSEGHGRGIIMMFSGLNKKVLLKEEAEQFARNDGFENLEEFYKYFPDNHDLTVIHWTEEYKNNFYRDPAIAYD